MFVTTSASVFPQASRLLAPIKHMLAEQHARQAICTSGNTLRDVWHILCHGHHMTTSLLSGEHTPSPLMRSHDSKKQRLSQLKTRQCASCAPHRTQISAQLSMQVATKNTSHHLQFIPAKTVAAVVQEMGWTTSGWRGVRHRCGAGGGGLAGLVGSIFFGSRIPPQRRS